MVIYGFIWFIFIDQGDESDNSISEKKFNLTAEILRKKFLWRNWKVLIFEFKINKIEDI